MSKSNLKSFFTSGSPAELSATPAHAESNSATKILPRLFVVDDDPVFCKLMERVGKQSGYHVQSFQSLGKLGESDLTGFDVGIVDFDLGCVDGIELASYIENQLGQIPLVFVSSTDRRKELAARREVGRATFVSKVDGPTRILEICNRSFHS